MLGIFEAKADRREEGEIVDSEVRVLRVDHVVIIGVLTFLYI